MSKTSFKLNKFWFKYEIKTLCIYGYCYLVWGGEIKATHVEGPQSEWNQKNFSLRECWISTMRKVEQEIIDQGEVNN